MKYRPKLASIALACALSAAAASARAQSEAPPNAPVQISSSDATGAPTRASESIAPRVFVPRSHGYVWDLAIDGDRLFAATHEGLAVYSVTDPARPSLRQFVPIPGQPYRVHTLAGLAAVESATGVTLVDVSPRRPAVVARFPVDPSVELTPAVLTDGTTLVLVGSSNVRVFQLDRPGGLRQIAGWSGVFVGEPALAEHTLFVPEGHLEAFEGAQMPAGPDFESVVDLRDPASPSALGRLPADAGLMSGGRDLWGSNAHYQAVAGAMPRTMADVPVRSGGGFLWCATEHVAVQDGQVVSFAGRPAGARLAVRDSSGRGCAEAAGWLYVANGLYGLEAFRLADIQSAVTR